jgi:glutaredoxin-related protein
MIVYVMSGCPDCTQVKELAKTDARFTLIDIAESPRNLKEFLRLRDTHPAFERVKERGAIGIPCFVQEDGDIVFSLNRLKNHSVFDATTDDVPTGAACSLDGKGG